MGMQEILVTMAVSEKGSFLILVASFFDGVESCCFAKGRVEPMKSALRRRFWLEISMAIVTCMLFVITLVQRAWIEVVFRVDPDNRSGALECAAPSHSECCWR